MGLCIGNEKDRNNFQDSRHPNKNIMQQIIIGTAGHVDHGKSALAKALTNVDPDRLPEEKARQMTIDLGFVFFPLNEEEEVAIIDVPGHERFLKTMIAGATSIRMVLFIVAADEGVMPQTIEHLDVLKLLGIEKGVIVITKIDKVEKEYIEVVKDDIKSLVKDSFLESAPVFTVSSLTNQGVDELKNGLKVLCQKIAPLSDKGIFRCPIDRIFIMKGFGSIVAGTVVSGKLQKSEAVELLPVGKISRIRNLQVHNESVSSVFAGQRAAFNLADITISEIARGYELSIPDYLKPTEVIDARFYLLPNARKSLQANERVRLHKGTGEVIARVIILDKQRIEPGEDGLVRFRLEKAIVGERAERFLLRSYSPMTVIGGGRFLELYPFQRGRRIKKDQIKYLEKLENIKEDEIVESYTLYAQPPFTQEKELMRLTNLPSASLTTQIQKLVAQKKIIKLRDNSFVHQNILEDLKQKGILSIKEFTNTHPLKVVMNKGELAKILKIFHPPLLEKILEELSISGKIELKADGIKLKGQETKLSSDAQRLSDALQNFAINAGFRPFRFNDIIDAFPQETQGRLKNLFDYLVKNDIFIKLYEDIYLHKKILEQAEGKLIQYLREKGTIRAIEYKDLLGVSRNVARDILDFFFDKGITMRTKGTHRLAGKEK